MTKATKKEKTYTLCASCGVTAPGRPHNCSHFLGRGPRCQCPQCRREEALRVKFDWLCKVDPKFTWEEFMEHIDGKVAKEERAQKRLMLQREAETRVMHYQSVHGHDLKVRFMFLRCWENHPVVTVALGKVLEGYYYRGISICHPLDNPSRRVGKIHALLRLNAALQGHDLFRRLSPEVSDMLCDEMDCYADEYLDALRDMGLMDKWAGLIHVSKYHAKPMECEIRLFQKPLPKNDGDSSALAEDAT